MTESMTVEVTEVRRRPRFKIRQDLEATFAGTPVSVTNLSAEGLGLRHSSPVKINSSGSIRIESEENTSGASFRGRIRWSRLSRTANAEGKYFYDSGVQIEEASDAAAGLLGRLIRAFGVQDHESIKVKQQVLVNKLKARATPPTMAVPRRSEPISSEKVLLIREANERLANNPESAQEWYNRAKFSLVNRGLIRDETKSSSYRREVIVIWEYLGGKIDLDVITMVLDNDKRR